MMIDHFGRHTALVIKNQRFADDSFEDGTDEAAFVQMRMNNIGFELPCCTYDAPRERDVEVEFVPR